MLVKLWLLTGEMRWILLHWEIEGNPTDGFLKRVLNYRSLIQLRYSVFDIATIILYVGPKSPHQTDTYFRQIGSTKTLHKFPVIKVLEQDEAKLLRSKNPFSIVILAILYVLRTKDKFEDRRLFKEKLFELAHRKKMPEQKLAQLIIFVDNFMRLPKAMQHEFQVKMTNTYEKKETKMRITESNRFYAESVYKAVFGFSPQEALKTSKQELTEALVKAAVEAEKAKALEVEKAKVLEVEKAKMEAEKVKELEAEKAKMEAERHKSILTMHKMKISALAIATGLELDLEYVKKVIAQAKRAATRKAAKPK